MSRNNNAMDGMRGDTNKRRELKIRDEFLKILRDNTFKGTDGGDVIDHISKILKITEWIRIPDVDMNQLRLHVFSKSLSGDAENWWNKEIKGTTIGWNEMCKKFSIKYYPLSHSYNSKDGKDINGIIDREYTPIPVPAHHDISNPDELCKTEEFAVMRYSMGLDEEFIAVEPSKISTVERNPRSMIYSNVGIKRLLDDLGVTAA
ncbi:hypothetical protein Tco_1184607 [Tanacetum coccineum]